MERVPMVLAHWTMCVAVEIAVAGTGHSGVPEAASTDSAEQL